MKKPKTKRKKIKRKLLGEGYPWVEWTHVYMTNRFGKPKEIKWSDRIPDGKKMKLYLEWI